MDPLKVPGETSKVSDLIELTVTVGGQFVVAYEFTSFAEMNSFIIEMAKKTKVVNAGRFTLLVTS